MFLGQSVLHNVLSILFFLSVAAIPAASLLIWQAVRSGTKKSAKNIPLFNHLSLIAWLVAVVSLLGLNMMPEVRHHKTVTKSARAKFHQAKKMRKSKQRKYSLNDEVENKLLEKNWPAPAASIPVVFEDQEFDNETIPL